jgi:poly(3-hydroxybutyrate) depolymerase
VKPSDIKTTALLSVEGELDDISGSGQTSAVHEICTGVPKSNQRHFEAKGAGHYGIFAGRRWREHVYPVVKGFILANNPATPDETTPKAAIVKTPAVKPAVVKPAISKPVVAKAVAAKRVPAKKAVATTKKPPAKRTTAGK